MEAKVTRHIADSLTCDYCGMRIDFNTSEIPISQVFRHFYRTTEYIPKDEKWWEEEKQFHHTNCPWIRDRGKVIHANEITAMAKFEERLEKHPRECFAKVWFGWVTRIWHIEIYEFPRNSDKKVIYKGKGKTLAAAILAIEEDV